MFVLVLNRAMRAYTIACQWLGLEADAFWLGYADDLVIMSTGERVAQQALMQLQAACAFVGLQINVAKTKCTGVSGEQAAVVQRAESQHECVIARSL